MIPKKAIEKAIEGGFDKHLAAAYQSMTMESWRYFATTPAFWQALGKALGWSGEVQGTSAEALTNYRFVPWLYYALKFTNLILTGGDVEKFWEEILS